MTENLSKHPEFLSANEVIKHLQTEWMKNVIDLGLGEIAGHLELQLEEKEGVVRVHSDIYGWDLTDAARGLSEKEAAALHLAYLQFLRKNEIESWTGIPVSIEGIQKMKSDWISFVISEEEDSAQAMAKVLKDHGASDQELENAVIERVKKMSPEELGNEFSLEEIIDSCRSHARRFLGFPL